MAAGIAMAGLGSQATADEAPIYRGPAEVVGPAMLSLAERRIVLYAVDAPVLEAGMAVVLPKETADYVASEAAAKSKGIGVWRGPFTAPADYREMLAGHPQER